MKIRVGIRKILEEMTISIAILLVFAGYNIGKGYWTGAWIILGTLVFIVFASWIIVNALIEWKKKRR